MPTVDVCPGRGNGNACRGAGSFSGGTAFSVKSRAIAPISPRFQPRSPMKTILPIVLCSALSVVPAFAETKPEPPVPVRTVAPEYPVQLRRDGVSGVVMVKCTIDEQGNVVDPQVEKSTDNAFIEPALAALKKWKFKPAKQDGTPFAMRVSIPIKFVVES
jgi:protein TonB